MMDDDAMVKNVRRTANDNILGGKIPRSATRTWEDSVLRIMRDFESFLMKRKQSAEHFLQEK